MRVTVADAVLDQIVRAAARGVEGIEVAAPGSVRLGSGRKPDPVEARAHERKLYLVVYARAEDEDRGGRAVPVLAERVREAVRACTGMMVGDVRVELLED